MPLRHTRRSFLRGVLSHVTASPEPECKVVTFEGEEDDDGGFLVLCRELSCSASPEADGSWELRFNVYVTTRTWWGRIDTRRKIPSATLQEKLSGIGIATEYDGQPTYPSLVGRSKSPIDPNTLMAQLQGLMRNVDVQTLYTEPNDETDRETAK